VPLRIYNSQCCNRDNYSMRNSFDFSCNKIKKNQMGGLCAICRTEKRYIEGFSVETWGKKSTQKT
jgi:hypothetical protein